MTDLEPRELLQQIKQGNLPASRRPDDLAGADLAGADLSGMDLSGANLAGADLSGAHLFRTNLSRASLSHANLADAELTGADLTDADLEEAVASRAGLGKAMLRGAHLFQAHLEGATLTMAVLRGADLRCAHLQQARMREADLTGADLTSADLRGVDLSLSKVGGATLNNADLRDARLRQIGDFASASWIGVDIRDINFAGAYRMRRLVVDQNFIKEFRESSRLASLVYHLWWITSDCGRSMTRWCLLILAQVLVFALLYSVVGVDYGRHPTWLSPLYFSVVTLTGLGYGDVVPSSPGGQAVAMLEVIIGYVMLGGLISIFSNLIARRAD